MRALNTLWTLCVIFIGFAAMLTYKNGTEAAKNCMTPMAQAIGAHDMERPLSNECKRLQRQGDVAEVFMRALP